MQTLSPWWKNTVILVMIVGFSVLIGMTVASYKDAAPIPARVVGPDGALLFTKADIQAGQAVFLKYGLMDNGTLWGHGAYLGPDFSADYLHTLTVDARGWLAEEKHGKAFEALAGADREAVAGAVRAMLKANHYDAAHDTLAFSGAEAYSFDRQIGKWTAYFATPSSSAGLPAQYIDDPVELRNLTAFFAWAAWASSANRPGKDHSYTNNFPYDPDAGNLPSRDAVLWSALSVVALLGGTAIVLFVFGKFAYLGWKGGEGHAHPALLPGTMTASQKAVVKYFVVVALLFLLQSLLGAATAHFRVDPGSFFGLDLSGFLASNLARTWHLQLAIFWIATAYLAGGLLLAPAVGGAEPRKQAGGVHLLFGALLVVALGSMLGEVLGLNGLLGDLWFWLGHQGWEYLELGRAWQVLLALGFVIWLVLLFRTIRPAFQNPERKEISSLFLYAAVAIPLFYLPAMFFNSASHFSVVDTWRFWIIHLWVEGFFELFVTVMVAVMFYLLGLVKVTTALRVVYLDAILYLSGGIVGTAHHWYWTGQSSAAMALGAVFSALEVVPLTLLTLDAADFIKLSRGHCDVCDKPVAVPHKWTFYFLMAVGFWNFLGAGVFGFLINMPIVSYFEVGTVLTTNHGHAAMMGVFGMLALALLVFTLRQASTEETWARVEKPIQVSFWGLNIGLLGMVLSSLFPGGVWQLKTVLDHGYWYARSPEFLRTGVMNLVEWLRMPADLIFIVAGVLPLLYATVRVYLALRAPSPKGDAHETQNA